MHDPRRAGASHLARRDELRLQLPRVGEVESENMRLDIILDGAELDAGNDANAELRAGGHCFGDAIERVVIGQRDRLQPDAFASRTTSSGARDPSDAVEWAWRSTKAPAPTP